MFVIFKTALAVFKKRKIQSALIAIIMILVSTMLFIGLSMVNQTSTFSTMFDRANAAESLLIISKDSNALNDTISWWENKEEVKEIITYETFMTNGQYMLKEKLETEMLLLTEYLNESEIDLIYSDEQSIAKVPEGNEMLINYNFANNRNLEMGDSVDFTFENETYEFIVSGFIVDPQFSNAFINPNRCFIAPGFFEDNNIENNMTIVAIKYYNIDTTDDITLYEAFTEESDNIVNPLFVDYKTIQQSYNIILGLIAAILLAISVFIFIIVIFVIKSTVSNIVLQQYKEIGVKKVIGYTNKQIRYSLIVFFSSLGLTASVIGAFIGLPIRNVINAGISSDIQVGLKSSIDIYLLLTVIIVFVLVFFFTYLATRKTGSVKPVQAIKYGMPERKVTKNEISISGTKGLPLSLLLAIKQLFANRRKTISTTFLIALLIYVALIIFNLGNTITNSEYLASHLLGNKIGSFSIVDNSDKGVDEVIEIIQNIEDVNKVIFYNYTLDESTKDFEGKDIILAGQVIYGNVPKEFMLLEDGRQSTGTNEITISSDVARATKKQVGDYITIKKAGEEVTYLISGTYNSISFSGLNYTIIQRNDPNIIIKNNGFYWVYSDIEYDIMDGIDAKIKDALGEEITISRYDSNVKNILSTVSSFPMIIQSLLLMFLVVSGVIMLNSTIMDINNSTKVYGIMKATGFSKGQITNIIIVRTLLMTLVGAIAGFIVNLLTMNSLMQMVFNVTPFSSIELPVLFDAVGSLLLVGLFIIIGIVGSMIPSRKIGRISPRQLIAE